MTPAKATATMLGWPYGNGHRFTASEMRRVMDGLGSYAFQWGLRAISPFHEHLRANPSRFTSSGYAGWTLVHATITPARQLAALERARGGTYLPVWWQLRKAGFRPVCPDFSSSDFGDGSVPLDFAHEVESVATRRGIAAISRWTWCRGCDDELAVTRAGFCETCLLAPVGRSSDTVRPAGAALNYVMPADL